MLQDFAVKPSGVLDEKNWFEGLHKVKAYEYDENGVKQGNSLICGPLAVKAKAVNEHGQFFIVLLIVDCFGNKREIVMPAKDLPETSYHTLAPLLREWGVKTIFGQGKELMKYLHAAQDSITVPSKIVENLGWTNSNNLEFVLPNRIIKSAGQEQIYYRPVGYSPPAQTMTSSGTLQDWKDYIAGKCVDLPYCVFVLACAFAAPLLKAANLESGGFHFHQNSGKGKTTLLQIASSVFGNGSEPSNTSFMKKWNNTANGLEGIAAAHNDLAPILDEIGSISVPDFQALVYNLLGNQGKGSMTQDRVLRTPRSWRCFPLSSGEISIREKLESDKVTVRTGPLVRMVDIPTKDIFPSASHADYFKQNCALYFGTALPAFLESLETRFMKVGALSRYLKDLMAEATTALVSDCKHLSDVQARVTKRFALVLAAAKLARELNILPECLTPEVLAKSCKKVFNAWLSESVTMTEEERGAIAVAEFCQKHQFARFQQVTAVERSKQDNNQKKNEDDGTLRDSDRVFQNMAGFLYEKDGERFFLFTEAGFKEACKGFSTNAVATCLKEKGLLKPGRENRNKHRFTIKGDRLELFWVNRNILSLSLHDGSLENDTEDLVQGSEIVACFGPVENAENAHSD